MARPFKGPRKTTSFRPPVAVWEAAGITAQEQGYDGLSDYISSVLAVAVGMPEHAPPPKTAPRLIDKQEPLPSDEELRLAG